MSEDIYLLRILQTLLQRNGIAYLWADADLIVRYATPGADILLDAAPLMGRTLPDVCPELIGVEDILRDIACHKRPPFVIEHINRDMPSGGYRYFSIRVSPPAETHPTGLVVLLEDTTHQGKLIQELNQSRNSLRLVQKQLEEVNRFKSISLAIASHEIRGRLGMVLGYTELLEMNETLDADALEMLATVRWGVHSLSMSLHQLISLDQIERGQFVLEQRACNLTALAQKVWKVYLKPVEKQFQVRCTLPDEALLVFGDENRLHQVFYNLVSNAVKYTPEGERITLGLTHTDAEARLWVENTGSGITPEDQQHLFQPYYRTSDRERLNKQGSGLGLFIVQQIVEAHGGRIEVDSLPHHHTRFTVYLPLYDPSQQEPL
ncbi:MAG: hypothetical protein Fur0018_13800 [Anaerolineales bacterium]